MTGHLPDHRDANAQEAQRESDAAKKAKKLAERSEDKAERRAQSEIDLRLEAERQRDEALSGQEESETNLQDEMLDHLTTKARLEMEAEHEEKIKAKKGERIDVNKAEEVKNKDYDKYMRAMERYKRATQAMPLHSMR